MEQRAEGVYDLYREGRQRLDAGDASGAAALLERALEAEPASAALHEALGRAYFGSMSVRRAREEFLRALELDPTDDYAHFGVGRCHEREGALRAAAKYYRLAVALSPRADYRAALARVEARIRS